MVLILIFFARLRGIMDDSTVRQMFRRYLCSPTKAPDVIKGHCAFDYREWCLIKEYRCCDEEKVTFLPYYEAAANALYT